MALRGPVRSAGHLVRPYTASNGRTRPGGVLEPTSLALATGDRPQRYVGPEHARLLRLCAGTPVAVAELAARVRLPVVVTKVLLADLAEWGAVTVRAPTAAGCRTGGGAGAPAGAGSGSGDAERELLEAVLAGLRKRL
ncbi:DUF742 domain-containing protein [Streptomyces albus subsp. chlorinus]|uniref:DUF742 domain-containing protein n=1 Tax=Streptomyces albus TaxID=1888 RepID=UPI00156E9610|nr:DUF742 domain-containing protein [Streptomyces albus]NSC24815.1 DUF742 domain-containing protein [Streptomyces albus subsp. chlorinus]